MFVALISVPIIDPGRPGHWGIPRAGIEVFRHEQWVIRSGPDWDVYEARGGHEIVDRTYWERQ